MTLATQPTRRTLLKMGAALPLLAALPATASTAVTKTYSSRGVAIDGSDAVAYFSEGKPVRGSKEFTHDWNGVTWRFSSAENRDLFAAAPEEYAPQYGGFCAYAVAQGSLASTIPEAWKIVDGKLYLNYSRRIQRRWDKNIAGYIADGDANWPSLSV
jgi:YHS domain-containing protein